MLVTVTEDIRRYYVGFEIDNSVKIKKGPNKGRPRTVTACKIYLVPNVRGKRPQFIASGVTVLGKKDKPDVHEGLKYALTRALEKARLGRYTNALIWSLFQTTHRRIDTIKVGKPSCAELFSDEPIHDNSGHKIKIEVKPFVPYVPSVEGGVAKANKKPTFSHGGPVNDSSAVDKFSVTAQGHKPVHGYGGSHAFRKKAIRHPWQITDDMHGLGTMYMPRRHEYSDIPFQSYTGKAAHIAHKGLGKAPTPTGRKIAGLGWNIVVAEATGEVIWPRTAAVKLRELRNLYGYRNYGGAEKRVMDHIARSERAMRQAEDRCHRVGEPKPITIVNQVDPGKFLEAAMGGDGLKRVKEIMSEADRFRKQRGRVRGLWDIADDKLTAEMQGMKLVTEFATVEAELLKRPGVTKFHDEYIIEPDVFKSEFKVGDVVTSDRFGMGTVTKVEGVFLTVQPGMRVGRELFGYGGTKVVPDWNCKKKVGRLKRFWAWATTCDIAWSDLHL